MSLEEKPAGHLAKSIKRERRKQENPVQRNIESGIYHAITVGGKPDPEGRGRLAAYIPKLGGDPDNPLFFQYASPFAGANGSGSYGFFSTPPDAGVTILVFFADNGALSEGYYFASVQEVPDVAAGGVAGEAKPDGTGQGEGSFKNQPAAKANHTELSKSRGTDTSSIDKKMDSDSRAARRNVATDTKDSGLSSKLDGKDGIVRVTKGAEDKEDEVVTGRNQRTASNNKNKTDKRNELADNHPRNVNTAVQGIYADPVRGQTTASPVRNASYKDPKPNSVYGWKTPGSNAITIDDGSVDDDGYVHPNQIRIQTGSGASVILDGTNDMIYMINSTGSGWVEIGAAGEVMVYGQGSISMRAEKDFNLRADQNINVEAGNNINFKAGNDFHINAEDQTHIKSGGTQFYTSGGANHTNVKTNMYVTTGGILHLNGPKAAISPGLSTVSHADVQNLESTKIDESILSTMVSHEPMLRNKTAPANNSSQSSGGSTANDGTIPKTTQDPSSSVVNDTTEPPEEQLTNDTSIEEQVGNGSGAVKYISGFSSQTRNKAIQDRLFSILESAAAASGVDVDIFSGGQDPKGTPNARRTGSIRHDNGFAADVWIYSNGKKLSTASNADLPIIKKFCSAAFAAGALSIGAAPGYMGSVGIHVDIAPNSPATVWGASHGFASAPGWLKQTKFA